MEMEEEATVKESNDEADVIEITTAEDAARYLGLDPIGAQEYAAIGNGWDSDVIDVPDGEAPDTADD